MVLYSPHLHKNIFRYFTQLVQIYLFITITHLLITPPISNNFYTSKFNHIFQKCNTLRFNIISMHSGILEIQFFPVIYNFHEYNCSGSVNVKPEHEATTFTANVRRQKVASISCNFEVKKEIQDNETSSLYGKQSTILY